MTGPTNHSTVVVAGAAGDLGARITAALTGRGADVRALIRPDSSTADRERLQELGAAPVTADPGNVDAVADASAGATVVVSALNGLREVILDRQSVLLDAAVRAGIPRFVSSDYSADFTRTAPGRNRNFDLRREFMGRADRAAIEVTSILNGAFMDMLGAEMPIIQSRIKRVLYWGDADQPMDFTTKDDTAAYTAAAALDPTTPRILRIAGDSLSARQLAETVSRVTGQPHRVLRAGSIRSLSLVIGTAQILAPQRQSVFPAWQGMQYLRDMFSGDAKLQHLDNDRYDGLRWTTVQKLLASRSR